MSTPFIVFLRLAPMIFYSSISVTHKRTKITNYSNINMWKKFKQASLFLRGSSLSDDPSKLHLSAGVDLKPMGSLFWLCTPRTAVQIIIIIGAL